MIDLLGYDLTSSFGEGDLKTMLVNMSNQGGSDLFLMGNSPAWMSILSRKEKVTARSLQDNEVGSIIESIYGDNARSRLGSRKPIDTHYEFKMPEVGEDGVTRKRRYRFRVNAVGCQKAGRNSMVITLRSIPTTPPSVSEIGVESDIINLCRSADQGLILVVGATGNGKSTLLASILRDQLEDENGHRNLITIESPIEFVYDYVDSPNSFFNQLEVGKHIDSFGEGVRNTLRMAPTTILVGEARDYETISAAVDASTTGHVVFSTVHANSVAETFQRMISVYPEEMQQQAKFNLVQSLKMVVAQRLIRTVDGKRTAIREYLILDQNIKNILLNATNIAASAFDVVQQYGRPIMADVKERFEKGVISEETFSRMKVNYELEASAHAS